MGFDDLPIEIRNYFVLLWKHQFSIGTECHRTEDEYVNLKKRSTFINLVVKANGHSKAIEEARSLAEDALHILRFLYQINFNIIDIRYIVKENKNEGGMENIAGLPFIGGANYVKLFGERIPVLTDIFIKSNPNEIEKKIRNAIRIFGIQTSVANDQVRFVLLVTCLESLLMTVSDRDYILWKLAEKTAFVLGKNKKEINEYVKWAYEKRSAFIHGSRGKEDIVTKDDIYTAQGIVTSVMWKLFDFIKDGYTQIQKGKDVKSIDGYIEEIKFRK